MIEVVARARRHMLRRHSVALVVALAFVVAFLGLASLFVQMTTNDHVDSIMLGNNSQVVLSAAAAMEEGAAAVSEHTGTPAQINTWAAGISESAPQVATLGRSCYAWWLSGFDAEAGTTRLLATAWAPGHLNGGECVTPENARGPVGTSISAQLERTGSGWRVIARVVTPLTSG